MKLNDKIVIDFKEFCSSGNFDSIRLGKTKEWIIHNFPDPDGYPEDSSVYDDDIWCYGNIEFHFQQEVLAFIFLDFAQGLYGGNSLEIQAWFLKDSGQLNLESVIQELNKAQLDFVITAEDSVASKVKLKILNSGLIFGFNLNEMKYENSPLSQEQDEINNQNEFKLRYFALE